MLHWFNRFIERQVEKDRKGRIDINEALLGSKIYKELSSKVDMLDRDVKELELLLGLLNISVKELLSALEEHIKSTKGLVNAIC